jgi:hypothetical protein
MDMTNGRSLTNGTAAGAAVWLNWLRLQTTWYLVYCLHNRLKIWERSGLQFAVSIPIIDFNLKGSFSSFDSVNLTVGKRSENVCTQLLVAFPVTSSRAIFHIHGDTLSRICLHVQSWVSSVTSNTVST